MSLLTQEHISENTRADAPVRVSRAEQPPRAQAHNESDARRNMLSSSSLSLSSLSSSSVAPAAPAAPAAVSAATATASTSVSLASIAGLPASAWPVPPAATLHRLRSTTSPSLSWPSNNPPPSPPSYPSFPSSSSSSLSSSSFLPSTSQPLIAPSSLHSASPLHSPWSPSLSSTSTSSRPLNLRAAYSNPTPAPTPAGATLESSDPESRSPRPAIRPRPRSHSHPHSAAHLPAYHSPIPPQHSQSHSAPAKRTSLVPAPALASAPHNPPSFVFHKALLLGLDSSPLRFALLAPLPHFYCHVDLYLGDFRDLSFQSLVAGYSLPLLWIFAPGLGLLLGLFQTFSLLAASTSSSSSFPADPELSLKTMDRYVPPPASSSSSSSSPSSSSSSSSQNQLRQDASSMHHRVATFGNTNRQAGIPSTTSSGHLIARDGSHPLVTLHPYHRHDIAMAGSSSQDTAVVSSSQLVQQSFASNNSSISRQVHGTNLQQQQHHSHEHEHGHNQRHSNNNSNNHGFNHGFGRLSHEYDDNEGLDDDEDRQSDEGSEGDPRYHEMEVWLQRCSICFDARLDFCLEFCRDQYCRECFQRYVKEVVSNSWGLNVTKIKCPVCQETIPLSEWSKYVDQSILEQYHQYNQPYRSFSRFCNECALETAVSQVNPAVISMPPRDLVPMFEQVLTDLRALLVLGGFTLDEPSLTLAPVLPSAPAPTSTLSPPPSPSATKPKQCFNDQDRDAVARWIVIQFTNDYQSYCGIAQGHYPSLHSKAQSYLTSLAYRTLGGPFIHSPQPSAVPPTPLTPSQSQNPLTLTLPTSVAPHPPQPAGSVQEPINNRSPGAIFQRRHHSARSVAVPGVLEMYKALIKALLSLFELGQKEQEGPTEIGGRIEVKTVDSTEGTTSRPVLSHGNRTQDFPSGSEDDDEDHKIDDSTGRLGMTLTAVEDVSMDLSSLKRKGSVSSTSPRPKRTRPGRPGVTTRAESKRKTDIKKAVVHISKQLSSMETRPEQWKELQFLHVRWLRWDWCNHCDQELCLQCGASSHHETQDCFTYMGSLVSGNGGDSTGPRRRSLKASDLSPVANASPTKASSKGKDRSDLDANTIQWKLANTNPCPNCCILIHRDDGCNKMDCMLCGYRFCWICREPWGVSCGFFKCGRKDVDSDAQKSHGSTAGHGIEESPPSEGQVRSLEVSRSTTGDADQPISRQEQRWDHLDEASAARVEKPEIGVPNVYVIHTKRSRA